MVLLLLSLAPAGLACVVAAWCFLAIGSRIPAHRDEFSDAIVLAAHQDDCVICAGEYASEAARRGRTVTIAYLTDGGTADERERASRRHEEAVDAWALAGLGRSSLRFLGLPQASSIRDDRVLEEPVLERIRADLAGILEAAPCGAAVFLPADGEDHGDHRLLRRIALEAVAVSGRDDLVVFECPEYNSYYSFSRTPRRALAFFLDLVPLASRLYRPGAGETRAETITGDLGGSLPPDRDRLNRKLEMLRRFVSEDGQMLVRLFGYPDKFSRHKPSGVVKPYYLRLGESRVTVGIIVLWALLVLSASAFPPAALSLIFDIVRMAPYAEIGLSSVLLLLLIVGLLRYRRFPWKFVFILVVLAGYCVFLLSYFHIVML